jgi:hypothetical protein
VRPKRNFKPFVGTLIERSPLGRYLRSAFRAMK